MAYGQKNYLEIQGINGKYRISQIGCFLVSFSNLLERFGKGITPLELNKSFKDKSVYIDVDDGIKDDLAWTSISKHNPNIVVTATGIGKPTNNNSIVKFSGLQSTFGTHFCLVADAEAGTIIDSWDGKVKSWNTYGGPKSWASYIDTTPVSNPGPVVSVATPNTIVVQKGWGISHVAKAAGYADFADASRWNYIAQLNGHADHSTFKLSPNQVVKIKGDVVVPVAVPQPAPAVVTPEVVNVTIQAGWGVSHALKAVGYNKQQWENPLEWSRTAELNGYKPNEFRLKPNQVIKVYKTPLSIEVPAQVTVASPTPTVVTPAPEAVQPVAPVVPPKEESEVKIEVKVNPSNPKAYQESVEGIKRVYIATTSVIVKDMDGLHMDRQLVKGQKVNGAQIFEKAGQQYVRTQRSVDEGIWYGIPLESLSVGQDPNSYIGPLTADLDEDDSLFDIDTAKELKELANHLSGREKIVALLARIQGVFLRVLQSVKLKKTKEK